MIAIKAKRDCCGCGACVQRCPKHCVRMNEDGEGFAYPDVDVEKCVDCGLCERVCPMLNSCQPSELQHVFAAKNRDKSSRELSSSGGLFFVLAERVVNAGGGVFGVVFDDKWEAHHVAATTIDELRPMMRSKYIQSRTENTFAEAEGYLKQGRRVMYTGTPCQIAGLKRFLRKDYDNLLAVDVICHGVPSPGVWRKYLGSLKPMSVIADISFREKSRSGFDWQEYGFVVWRKSANKGRQHSVLLSCKYYDNPFMRGFLADLYLRPSCHACPAKGGTSGADITIADYWGIRRVRPDFYDPSGVGLAIVHTQKGMAAFVAADFETAETTLEEATADNASYCESAKRHRCRGKFFRMIGKNVRVDEAVATCLRPPLPVRIWKKIRRRIGTIYSFAKV